MEKIVQQGLLYDYYGQLLTGHQQQIYEDAVTNDLSLSELADAYGISRQGVHDLLRRCDRILGEYEEKLGYIKRDQAIRAAAGRLLAEADSLSGEQIKELANEIIGHL